MRPLIVLAALALAACEGAPRNSITMDSDPPGAVITDPSGARARMPAALTLYETPPAGGCDRMQPVTATWDSGASVTERVRVCGSGPWAYTFRRPAGAPGLDLDLARAELVLSQQIAALEEQGRWNRAMAGAVDQTLSGYRPPDRVTQRPIRCTAQADAYGNVQTVCR
tara:strand:+ start:1927 stop:2430 length:504 start_codon:yes stop_codon:yes gene_type:complete